MCLSPIGHDIDEVSENIAKQKNVLRFMEIVRENSCTSSSLFIAYYHSIVERFRRSNLIYYYMIFVACIPHKLHNIILYSISV